VGASSAGTAPLRLGPVRGRNTKRPDPLCVFLCPRRARPRPPTRLSLLGLLGLGSGSALPLFFPSSFSSSPFVLCSSLSYPLASTTLSFSPTFLSPCFNFTLLIFLHPSATNSPPRSLAHPPAHLILLLVAYSATVRFEAAYQGNANGSKQSSLLLDQRRSFH
jgi:hypothetical protein